MTTLDVSIAAGADDASERADDSNFTAVGTTIRVRSNTTTAARTSGGFRFPGVTIAQGATIDVAYVTFSLGNASRNDPNLTIYCEGVDDAANYTDTADLMNRTLTTASVDWEASDVASTAGHTFNTPSLVSIVQEVIDRAGWASGNDLNVILHGKNAATGDLEIYAYENGVGATVAALHVEYTESGGTDALTPNDLATGTPTLTAAAIGQIHVLSASDLSAGTLTLSTPALGQIHALSGTDLVAGTPALDAPAIGQAHALTGSDLATGAPSLGSPALGQIHALTATDLATGTPTLGTPTLGTDGTDALTANDLATGVPTLSTPSLGQVHALAGNDLTAGTPTLGTPSIGQVHALAGNDLATGSPTLSTPAIGQVHALSGSDLVTGTPFFGAATLGQIHGLTALDLVTGTPTLSTPELVGDAGSVVTAVYTVDLLANITPTANAKANITPTVSLQSNPTPAQEVYSG